jgi:translation initiation factor 3 subunit D
MTVPYRVPEIPDNDDGWGPTTMPEQLEGVPYAPYGKGEKVGRISDFTQSGFNKYGGKVSTVQISRS